MNWSTLIWSIVAAALAGIGQGLASGQIIPPVGWAWLVPVIVLAIVAFTDKLRKPTP